jgi:hypothetical protein
MDAAFMQLERHGSGNHAVRTGRWAGCWLEIRDELPRNPLGKILKRELRDESRQ